MKWVCVVVCLLFGVGAAEERCVVGIHGLISDTSSMLAIRHHLRCVGMSVYLWEYNSIEATVCEHAHCLVETLRAIAQCRPECPIDFVTHSVGALILRQALNLEGCPEEAKIGRAVLLAPPNQGSCLARKSKGIWPVHWFLGSKIGCDLMRDTPGDIQAMGPFPESMRVLVVAGCQGNHLLFQEPNDCWITVQETALETPYYREIFHLRHGALLTNPRVLELVASFLTYGCGQEDELQDNLLEPVTEAS